MDVFYVDVCGVCFWVVVFCYLYEYVVINDVVVVGGVFGGDVEEFVGFGVYVVFVG